MDLVTIFFLAAAGIVLVGLVMMWTSAKEKVEAVLANRPVNPNLQALQVFADVRARVVRQFVGGAMKGTQLRHALHGKTVRVSYAVKKLPNGVEHRLSVSPDSGLPKDKEQVKVLLAGLAQLAVFLGEFSGLEPVLPLDIDVESGTLALTRVLTEDQTRELQAKRVKLPPTEEAEARWTKAEAGATEARRDIAAA